MRVKITQPVTGNICGHWSPQAGDEIEVPDNIGALLCSRKIADPVTVKAAKVETRKVAPKPAPKVAPKARAPRKPKA